MNQNMAPVMDVVGGIPKPVVNPNQYLLKDSFGNFAYGYSTQNSERAEEGDGNSVKGHFANIMADGKLRRVDYIADDQGFHILRDTADNTRRFIKREAEADNIQVKMSTSASLRDSTQDAEMSAKMSMTPNSLLGHDMSMNNMRNRNNQMSSNMYMSSDMMGRDMSSNMMVNNAMGQKMYTMGKDMSSPMIGSNMGKMMRQNMYQIVPSWDETTMGNNVGQTSQPMVPPPPQPNVGNNMDKTMMGAPMFHVHNMGHNNKNTGFNMFWFPMFGSPMMGQKPYTNMMGRDMSSSMMGNNMYSNLMGRDMNGMAPVNMMSQT